MDTARLQQVFHRGNVAAVHWATKSPHPVVWISASVHDLLGFEPEDFTEGRISYLELIHPDDLLRVLTELESHLSGSSAHFFHEDYRLQHASGGWVWVCDHTVVERHEDGSVKALLGYLVEVTQRHRTEEELREKSERLALVLEGTRLGLWDWDPRNNQVHFDEHWARMLGHDLSEIPAALESWSSRVHPDDLKGAYEALQRHMDGEVDYYEHVHRMRHKDGHWVWILDRGRVVEFDVDGMPARFSGTHTDITAQKEAEVGAHAANRAKTLFLARMSHEIRTPLNGVLGVLQLLSSTELDEQQMEYTETIRESGETLLTIINDILDLSKVEAGEFEFDPRPFDVRRTLRGVFELYDEHARSKGLGYEMRIDAGVPAALLGDDHRIRQILANLISNAVKFTSAGEVSLRVRGPRLEDGRVLLTARVVDTGPGIVDTDRIWEAFGQESAAIAREHGGTGLGLSISRQLCEAMGGTLELESTPGVGSTFVLRLPMEIAETPEPAGPRSIEAQAEALPRLRVLVAEDNRVNQMVIQGVLRRLDQDVLLVDDGRAALEACQDEDFDLVLMDIHMPHMNGFEAAKAIRDRLPAARLPRIVAISADAFAHAQEEFRSSGMVDAVTKPFRVEEITRVLAETATTAKTAADMRRSPDTVPDRG